MGVDVATSVADARIEELRRRLGKDPTSRLFAQLAEEHRRAGEHEEAVRVARAGLAVHPGYASARLTLGRALLARGEWAAACGELEETVRQAPSNLLASRCLAEAREAAGDLQGALRQHRRTLEMSPDDAALRDHVESLRAKIEAQPRAENEGEPPFSSSTLAELYLRQGLVEQAVGVYRRVVAAEPANERARQRLAEIESRLGVGQIAAANGDLSGRRRGMERAIGSLEALLAAMRRR